MTAFGSTTIAKVLAREVLDSRGNPTVEADVVCAGGAVGRAIAPSGASTGEHEAVELRDADKRYGGKGVLKAVSNVADIIGPALLGLDATEQERVDQILIDLDGTANKAHLGANALLAVSMAAASAAAAQVGLPLFRYLGGDAARTLPVPCLNVLNGGVHAANALDIQEFMIVPAGLPTFREALRAGTEVYHALKRVLASHGLSTNVGDEGGVAPDVSTDREALGFLMDAIAMAGYEAGTDVGLALDIAASELFEDGVYSIGGLKMTSDDLSSYLKELADEFPLVSIEDAMDENDWVGWKNVTKSLGGRVQLVGDDVFATNGERLQRGIDEGAANAILIKVNQIGTLSETLRTIEIAERASYGRMISHRSGETEDTFIAHLVVATHASQIKAGAPARGERTAKYNELLRIEEELGDDAVFPGWKALSL